MAINDRPVGDTIGEWDVGRLVRFIKDLFEKDPPPLASGVSTDELTVNRKLILLDEIQFSTSQTTVGGVGGASAPPATPYVWVKVLTPAGEVGVIPVYLP